MNQHVQVLRRKIAKIVVIRTTIAGGPNDPSYRVLRLTGPAEVEIPARTNEQKDRTLLVGDSLDHEELKRLASVQVYDVTVTAQSTAA